MGQHQPRSPLLAMTSSTLNLHSSDIMLRDNPTITSVIHDFHSIESCFGQSCVCLSF